MKNSFFSEIVQTLTRYFRKGIKCYEFGLWGRIGSLLLSGERKGNVQKWKERRYSLLFHVAFSPGEALGEVMGSLVILTLHVTKILVRNVSIGNNTNQHRALGMCSVCLASCLGWKNLLNQR